MLHAAYLDSDKGGKSFKTFSYDLRSYSLYSVGGGESQLEVKDRFDTSTEVESDQDRIM